MVKTYVEQTVSFGKDWVACLPPGLFICLSTAYIEGGRYFQSFRHEFVGTLLMIMCTFSAGKWVGRDNLRVAWTAHAMGVITADYLGGGPHVNPAVTTSMWALGKCSYTESYVRVSAQLAGGLVSFPIFAALAHAMDWDAFGGPEFHMSSDEYPTAEAFMSEFIATFLLMFAIYILNWEINFGTYHYIIKQTLTAVAIRALIEYFPTAGPAMNPMLGTSWAVFGVGEKFEFPSEFEHYFVYWIGPCSAALLASVVYAIYSGETIFGVAMPIGPIKKPKSPPALKKKRN